MASKKVNKDELLKEYDENRSNYDLLFKTNKTPTEIIRIIMEQKGYNVEKIKDLSKLSKQTIYRLINGTQTTKNKEEYKPTLSAIISFCMACDLDIMTTSTLL